MVLDGHRDGDASVHLQGIDFVYDKHEKALFDQTVIDYKENWFGQGFTVCSPTSEPC